MNQVQLSSFDYSSIKIPTPYYIIDRALLRRNMKILSDVQSRSGGKILLALKAFSTWGVFSDMIPFLSGVTCSSVHEAMLGKEEFGKEIHMYSPAYSREEMKSLLPLVDHLVFNSINQWKLFRPKIQKYERKIQCGLRINPEYSEVQHEMYNPCNNRSRFGIRADELELSDLKGIDGFHFHTMCQQGSDVLERTLELVVEKFERFFRKLKWINFGGGHHITRKGYDVDYLCNIISHFRAKYGLDVYLEPGEAHVLNTGFLVATVLDVIENPNSIDVVIVDTSASAHMPDVIEMPYVPEILNARRVVETMFDGPLEEGRYKYIVGSKTCLSGDIIGEYLFKKPLRVGQRVTFTDMSQYTMCKNTAFNGLQLPAIVSVDSDTPSGSVRVIRKFDYSDYKVRLS